VSGGILDYNSGVAFNRLRMKTIVCAVLIVASVALNVAAQYADHQITGRVLEADDWHIVVEKGKQRLHMGLAGWVKWPKYPKAGDIVTIHYIKGRARGGAPSYTAEKVEIKDAGGSIKN
jgi:hypothetical protein